MMLNRKDIFKNYPWIAKRNNKFIISADYNGLLCASFLSHILDWELVGYYDLESLWISEDFQWIWWISCTRICTLGQILHVLGLEPTFWHDFLMILHGF